MRVKHENLIKIIHGMTVKKKHRVQLTDQSLNTNSPSSLYLYSTSVYYEL